MRIIRKIATSDKTQRDYDDQPLEERKEASGVQPRTVRGRRNDARHKKLTDRPRTGR